MLRYGHLNLLRLVLAISFLVAVTIYGIYFLPGSGSFLIIAAVIGAYMAMNIGANDVANNVGPAVGSGSLSMAQAIVIAATFESAGALIAGGEVVSTIKKGIIDPALISNGDVFIWLMMAALLAGALWLNIATTIGVPVSTTHSIVGGVLGAGIAAAGWGIADWGVMGKIAASWVISPVLGGLIAALFLYLIKRNITYKEDKLLAAKKVVPFLVALMAWAFSTYLILKGLKKIWKIEFHYALGFGLVFAAIIYTLIKKPIAQKATQLTNTKSSINTLFTLPLICSAALLSFAHGANDVANAIGPLAAINDALTTGGISNKASIPLWVMVIGALGISTGLALYGPKLIRTIGSEITELDKMRAFCIAMSASITVIIASQLGLPVSSTHIAVGAVFGVGFLREYLKTSYSEMLDEICHHHDDKDHAALEEFLRRFHKASIEDRGLMIKQLKAKKKQSPLNKKARKRLGKVHGKELVKRSAVHRIAAAWLITVPMSAFLAAFLYFTIRGMLLP
ncbi:MAG TPA: inorganic phosphate transporter [Crenotrichaceae bacterium]|nr:inorganic phosphate transporter [Crenotrichaceae bacterium]